MPKSKAKLEIDQELRIETLTGILKALPARFAPKQQAERMLVELAASGYVLMKKYPGRTITNNPPRPITPEPAFGDE